MDVDVSLFPFGVPGTTFSTWRTREKLRGLRAHFASYIVCFRLNDSLGANRPFPAHGKKPSLPRPTFALPSGGCHMSRMTLKMGVEENLKKVVPQVKSVITV